MPVVAKMPMGFLRRVKLQSLRIHLPAADSNPRSVRLSKCVPFPVWGALRCRQRHVELEVRALEMIRQSGHKVSTYRCGTAAAVGAATILDSSINHGQVGSDVG